MKTFTETKNFYDNPMRVYVSKKNGNVYALSQDETTIEINKPLTGLSLLLYNYVGENNVFKIYDLKQSLNQ